MTVWSFKPARIEAHHAPFLPAISEITFSTSAEEDRDRKAGGTFSTGVMSQADFLPAGHIVMRPPKGGGSFAQRAFDRLGIKPGIEVTPYFFASLPLLVRGSRRIGLVQRSLAQVLSKLGGIRIVEPPFALPALQHSPQWHSDRTRDPALLWIRGQLHETVRVIAEDGVVEGTDHVT